MHFKCSLILTATILFMQNNSTYTMQKSTFNKDFIARLEQTSPYAALFIKLYLPFDSEHAAARSYRLDECLMNPTETMPRSADIASALKAAGCYVVWESLKQGFEKVTGQPLAIPTIDLNRYKEGTLKHKASKMTNLGINGINIGIDLTGPLMVSYTAHAVGNYLDKDESDY